MSTDEIFLPEIRTTSNSGRLPDKGILTFDIDLPEVKQLQKLANDCFAKGLISEKEYQQYLAYLSTPWEH